MKFDLARQVRVFNSRFQFVEFEMTGLFISRKKVPIPSDLLGLAKDEQAKRQLHASFDLVAKSTLEVTEGKRKISEETIRRRKNDIIRRFLIPLKGYGSVVLRTRKDEFAKEAAGLKAEVAVFQKGVKVELQKRMDENRDALVDALLPGVEKNPPDYYTKFHGPKPPKQILEKLLREEITHAFGKAEDVIEEMKVTAVFKDVTYESLIDPEFIRIAQQAMPGVEFLHDESSAAMEAR